MILWSRHTFLNHLCQVLNISLGKRWGTVTQPRFDQKNQRLERGRRGEEYLLERKQKAPVRDKQKGSREDEDDL